MEKVEEKVIRAIESELRYQTVKWGPRNHSPMEWVVIMEKCLTDAKRAWVTQKGNDMVLDEVRQVVAVGVKCMMQHGSVVRNHWMTEGPGPIPAASAPRSVHPPSDEFRKLTEEILKASASVEPHPTKPEEIKP